MANIPGATSVVPGVYSETKTLQRGVSVPTGSRLALIIGEGLKEETLVGSANGNGNDGFNPTYTSSTGSDGRHFLLGIGQDVVAPVVINRSRLFKNGIELNLSEDVVDLLSFDSRFDARLDPETGQIELQPASLVRQTGDQYYKSSTNNIGNGTISNLTLVDINSPPETWTIRCTSVRRDGGGNPMDGYAKFIARGSESGIILDGYGNQIFWQSNGSIISNTILRFSILEGVSTFQEGDSFIIQTTGGPLVRGDNLIAKYISVLDLNDPEFFTDLNVLVAKHGQPTAENRLSLGSQLAFANGCPGVFAIQAKPSIPRRISYTLVESAVGNTDPEEFIFELPLNIVPDVDSNINFFITSISSGVETQIIPNKVDFYNQDFRDDPESFITSAAYDYSYTVIVDDAVEKTGYDGYLVVTSTTTATLYSANVQFGSEDSGKNLQIENSTSGNDGQCNIVSVINGILQLESLSPMFGITETGVDFFVLNPLTESCRILITDDIVLSAGDSLRVTIVDTNDADFFDAGWVEAYDSAEKIEVDIVVPLPSQTISVILQNGKVHVETMSNIRNRKERVLLTGAISGLTPANVLGTQDAAVEDIGILEGIQGDDVSEILDGITEDLTNYDVQNAFGDSYRVVYFYPDQIVIQAGSNNELMDGFFIAAAAAGYFSGNTAIQEPLTNKTLSGFSILRDKMYAPLVQENISKSGITLLTPVAGGGKVVWGKTTTISLEATEEEISIVFIRDNISKTMRRAFLPYIGRAESITMKATLFSIAQGLMKSFIQQRLITAYDGLVVNKDSVEPRQWNVSVAVQPTYPTNWIFIAINVGRLD
jgi:hypothetical protein